MVLVGPVERFNDLERSIAGCEHHAAHMHDRMQHRDAEAVRHFGIGWNGVNRFLRADDLDPEFGLKNFEKRR